MLKRLLEAWVVLAIAMGLTAWLLPDIDINGGVLSVLWIAALFGLVNAILGPILRLISLPVTVLTLGLFSLVINAFLLEITSHLSDHFDVHGFWAAFWGAILISIFSTILGMLLKRFDRVDA